MGSKLEKLGKTVEKASEMQHRGLEQGEKAATEVQEIKAIIEAMDKDVDEDIGESIDATLEDAKNEGTDYMRSEVHGQLEKGYETAGEAIKEGTEQAETSRNAADSFSDISATSEFGRTTAENSATNAEKTAEQFEKNVENAEKEIEYTEDRYKKLEDDILG